MKFGAAQLGNPTPRNIGRIFKIVIAINSSITVWMGTADYIPSFTAKVVGSILSLVTILCVALEPFFGVETKQKDVPIENVTEMKQ